MIDAAAKVLRDGRTHWRREPAVRLALLVDGEADFAAFPAAGLAARHVVRIVGWDIHSRMRLVASPPQDGLPAELGPFLNALLRRRPARRVAVWRRTPRADLFTLRHLVAEVQALSDWPWLPVYVLCTFVFGDFLMVPVTLLIAASGVAFGPVLGFAYAALGAFSMQLRFRDCFAGTVLGVDEGRP